MSTIVSATTIHKEERTGTTRLRFRYVLDDGAVHERNAWVLPTVDETTERTNRGEALLVELAEAEFNEVIQ